MEEIGLLRCSQKSVQQRKDTHIHQHLMLIFCSGSVSNVFHPVKIPVVSACVCLILHRLNLNGKNSDVMKIHNAETDNMMKAVRLLIGIGIFEDFFLLNDANGIFMLF